MTDSEEKASNGTQLSSESEHSGRRRTASKAVNYNEKEADAALAKKIKKLEKKKVNKSRTGNSNGKIATSKGTTKRNYHSRKAQNGNFKYQSFLQDKSITWNFIPSLPTTFRKYSKFSNTLETDEMTVDVIKQVLLSDGNVVLKQNDHIYMVSEPPGEPYYIGRIIKFVARKEFQSIIEQARDVNTSFPAVYFQLQMNWYYRPRDIHDNPQNVNPRILYASLHNDVCPIHSFRGKCHVLYEKDFESVEHLAEYTAKPNNFYFNQLFDRFTLKYYQIESTKKIFQQFGKLNYFKALASKFPYVFYEEKFPLSNIFEKYVCGIKSDDQTWDSRCKECTDWCQNASSIKCDDCKCSIHLWCMDPPLEKKPSKGVIWVCFNCVSKQNKEDHVTPEQQWQDIQDEAKTLSERALFLSDNLVNKENWWFQYMGEDMCSHLAEPLMNDFIAPYPWKKSRVSSQKAQWKKCNDIWAARPYDGKNEERGNDGTVELLWKWNPKKITINALDSYVATCKAEIPSNLNVQPEACNFLDSVVKKLMDNDYDPDKSFVECQESITRDSLREPTFTQQEITKFEEGIALHGSELHPVYKHVGTQSMAMIVRYYYYWKKTPQGKNIWGNFKGRLKNRKKEKLYITKQEDASYNLESRQKRLVAKTENTMLWKHIDDSSFDSEKISNVKTCFRCMFCSIDYSPLWYRVTGGSDDDHICTRIATGVNEKVIHNPETDDGRSISSNDKLNALCIRCARIWRRYGVKWENPLDILKKLYGNSALSLQNVLTELLEDAKGQSIICPSIQGFTKNIEWELIQDAECITKQRILISENPEKLVKMKRNTLSSHAQMNKAVKKMLDLESLKTSNLEKELKSYVYEKHEEIRRKEEKKLKRLRERELQEKLVLEAFEKKPSSSKDITTRKLEIKNVEKVRNANSTVKKLTTSPANTVTSYSKSSFVKRMASNGDFVIEIPEIKMDNDSIGTIVIDSTFTKLKISDNLMKFFKNCNERSLNIDKGTTKKKKYKPNNIKQTEQLQFINSHNIPRLKSYVSTPKDILRMYNYTNPLYHEWNIGKLSVMDSDLFQYNDTYPSKSNNVGRKSKSPILELKSNENSSANDSRSFCCVCLCDFNPNGADELLCTNCGLNVHSSCYGVKTKLPDGKSPKDYQWLCDPCSNDRNPIVSTNYQCVLCNAREIDHDSAKKGFASALPDALKFTIEGSWCHITCALYGSMIKFGSIDEYQPFLNVNATLKTYSEKKCDICNLLGGLLVKCEFCHHKFHVTCSIDSQGFFLGFKKEEVSTADSNSLFTENNLHYKARPTIVCSKHTIDQRFVPLSYVIKATNKSIMKYYISKQKYDSKTENMTSIQLRRLDRQPSEVPVSLVKSETTNGDNQSFQTNKPKSVHCYDQNNIESIYNDFCNASGLEKTAKMRNSSIDNEASLNTNDKPNFDKSFALLSTIDTSNLFPKTVKSTTRKHISKPSTSQCDSRAKKQRKVETNSMEKCNSLVYVAERNIDTELLASDMTDKKE